MAIGSLWARVTNRRPTSTFARHFSARQFAAHLLGFATWVPVMIWFNTFVAEVTLIEGPSMYPFLNAGYNETLRRDLCLNWKWYAREKLARGMIVTFRTPHDPEKIAVKRIVGLPGDVVHTRSPYPSKYIRVPVGHIWVEGDVGDKRLSIDSNTYGPISAQLVIGQITHILLPLKKAGRVKWWEHPDRVGVVGD